MSDLNLRGVSQELVRRLKVRAAEKDMTLRDYCVMVLDAGVESRSGPVILRAEAPRVVVEDKPAWEPDIYSQE